MRPAFVSSNNELAAIISKVVQITFASAKLAKQPIWHIIWVFGIKTSSESLAQRWIRCTPPAKTDSVIKLITISRLYALSATGVALWKFKSMANRYSSTIKSTDAVIIIVMRVKNAILSLRIFFLYSRCCNKIICSILNERLQYLNAKIRCAILKAR